MAKKRKKHSRAVRDQRLFSNIRTWMWESEPADAGSDFILHIQKKAMLFGWTTLSDPRMVENLFAVQRNWVICGRALVRTPDGATWMEQADMTLPSCKLLEVRKAYVELRRAVLAENQTRHVFDCGWIAQTWLGEDPTNAEPDWVFHDAPAGLLPTNSRIPAGLGYTPERQQWWQEVNLREQRRNLEVDHE